MAICPKCGTVQNWLEVLRLTKTDLLRCPQCGAFLSIDSQRATVLVGGLVALLLLPEVPNFPVHGGALWFMGVLAFYMPFHVYYIKLLEVSDSELSDRAEQRERFERHARHRHSVNSLGNFLLWGGLPLMLAGFCIASPRTSEMVACCGTGAIILGITLLSLERCPFCRKITVHQPNERGYRCVNCHRCIDSDD